ncbi:hypothetical protein [Hydrogenophaga sp.]|jgi:hypothetical protein|uniref:hypothetical protein n=1 Tax=Hydrogenophaga sp. TaxID=1904254 RepID=UPI00391B23D8
MRAQGILNVASADTVTQPGDVGPFVLRLVAQDRLAPTLTTWHIRWTGRIAEAFWRRHGRHLLPGRSVHVELEDVHGLPGTNRREAALGACARAVVLLPQWDGATPTWPRDWA